MNLQHSKFPDSKKWKTLAFFIYFKKKSIKYLNILKFYLFYAVVIYFFLEAFKLYITKTLFKCNFTVNQTFVMILPRNNSFTTKSPWEGGKLQNCDSQYLRSL